MRILDLQHKTTFNKLVKAVQEYCHALLASPSQHEIFELENLDHQLKQFIGEISPLYLGCSPEKLHSQVHSYLTFEVYNLHFNEILLISITSRKTEFEEAFRDYDDLRYDHLPQVHRFYYARQTQTF